MSLTRANGLTFHTQVLGEGPAVMMLHGFFGNLSSWYFTAAPAIARTHRVLMYDLRGHGRTERTLSGYDLATMTADLSCLLDAFGERNVSLAGHSYGGAIALQYALIHPERVNRIALVDVPMPPSNMEEIAVLKSRQPRELLEVLPASTRNAVLRGERGRRAHASLETLKYLIFESSLMSDISGTKDFSDETLARLTCPVRCIYGSESKCLDAGRRLSRIFPRGQLVILQGGHYLPVEAAGPLTACLQEFLDG